MKTHIDHAQITHRGIRIIKSWNKNARNGNKIGAFEFDIWQSAVVPRAEDAPKSFASERGAKAFIDRQLDR